MNDNSWALFQVTAHQSEGTDRTYLEVHLLWHRLMFTFSQWSPQHTTHTHLLFYFSDCTHTPSLHYTHQLLRLKVLRVFWHGPRLWDDPKTKRCSFHIGLFPRGYFVGERPLISSYCQTAPFLAKKRKSFTLCSPSEHPHSLLHLSSIPHLFLSLIPYFSSSLFHLSYPCRLSFKYFIQLSCGFCGLPSVI